MLRKLLQKKHRLKSLLLKKLLLKSQLLRKHLLKKLRLKKRLQRKLLLKNLQLRKLRLKKRKLINTNIKAAPSRSGSFIAFLPGFAAAFYFDASISSLADARVVSVMFSPPRRRAISRTFSSGVRGSTEV